MTAVFDPRGCLTPAGMAALQEAPPGQAPAELARHLAACARCQARLLGASTGRVDRPGAPPEIPAGVAATRRLWRTVVFVGAALFLAVVALAVLALVRPGS